MSRCEYFKVDAYECPYCGVLVLVEDAEETCWSCDKEVAYPGEGDLYEDS